MSVLIASAFFVGLSHTLSPAHWLPVVLISKTRKWSFEQALAGALAVALSHILISTAIGFSAVWIGEQIFKNYEEQMEASGALFLTLAGFAYAGYAAWQHYACRGHSHGHHGPELTSSRSRHPWAFLFTLGLAPCVAMVPLYAAAAARGWTSFLAVGAGFTAAVVVSLVGSTLLARGGMMKLDHPWLEHYGEVVTGLGIAATGAFLWAFGAH